MLQNPFPILNRKINGHRLVYLDNASTTQKPESVIQAMADFYRRQNANIHRGIHTLSQEATKLYEGTRDKVQKFVNAKHREEIIFTSSATEAINLVVWTWGHENIHAGDEILLTEVEHHSNLVPWQILAKKKRAKLKFIPIHNSPNPSYLKRGTSPLKLRGGWEGLLDLRNLEKLLTRRTKIVSLAHVSNVLGTINPVEKIIKLVRQRRINAKVLIDGAQAGGHVPVNVQKLDCDFYVLAGHKMYGPSGTGILYGKKELLNSMPPYQSGGHIIKHVTLASATWTEVPAKFEAGTGNLEGVIGLGAAIDYLNSPPPNLPHQGGGNKKRKFPSLEGRVMNEIVKHESVLTSYALKQMLKISGLKIYGPQHAKDRIGVISFNLKGIPPHDLASIMDDRGIAIRSGHHCAQPLCQKLGIESSARISLAIYNTKEDIDAFIAGIKYAQLVLSSRT